MGRFDDLKDIQNSEERRKMEDKYEKKEEYHFDRETKRLDLRVARVAKDLSDEDIEDLQDEAHYYYMRKREVYEHRHLRYGKFEEKDNSMNRLSNFILRNETVGLAKEAVKRMKEEKEST